MRQWCRMPLGSAAEICAKDGTWDPDAQMTLCPYHSEKERLVRQLKAEADEAYLPEHVRLNELIESMKAHPAGWRKKMLEEWYGEEEASPFLDNRGGK